SRTDITNKVAVGCESRDTTIKNPAVFTVATPEPILRSKTLTRGERRCELAHASLEVIGVHPFGPAIAQLLFKSSAGEVEPRLTNICTLYIGVGHPDQHRRGVRQTPKPLLTLA